MEAWIVDYCDGDGDRHIHTFERKKDAEAYHATVKVDVRAGMHTPASKSLTVAQAAEEWIKGVALERREASTLAQYRQHAHHITRRIGNQKLASLTTPRLNAFRDELLTSMSRPMGRKVMSSLKSLLKDAQRRGNVAQNVALAVKQIDVDKRGKGRLKVGVHIPTADEIKAIIAAAGPWRPLLMTAIFAGLRASELRGLRWEDVDLKRSELHVRQRADRYNVMGKPKSKAGDRLVPLGPLVLNALREWKLACPKGELGLVFPTIRRTHCRAQQLSARAQGHDARRWVDGSQGKAEVRRSARAAALLCVVVHQSARSRWPRLAAESGAGTTRTFLDRDDDGHVRSSVSARRRCR